jgi:hypothetical protein
MKDDPTLRVMTSRPFTVVWPDATAAWIVLELREAQGSSFHVHPSSL